MGTPKTEKQKDTLESNQKKATVESRGSSPPQDISNQKDTFESNQKKGTVELSRGLSPPQAKEDSPQSHRVIESSKKDLGSASS